MSRTTTRQTRAAHLELRSAQLWRNIILLKVLAKLASTFLLAWLFVSPAMACLLPIAQLSQEEKACCRSMAGMCGEMAKNSSHSCCVKVQTHNPSCVIAKAGPSSVQHLPATSSSFAAVHQTIPAATSPGATPAEYGYPPGSSPPELYTLHACLLI